MIELVGSILVLLGAIFHFSAGLGMLRMPDAYTRMQAGTKASTLGNTLVLAGLTAYHPG
jgi:multicomponent Na+:H+ antiporter subunit G